MQFGPNDEKKLIEFVKGRRQASRLSRSRLNRDIVRAFSFYEGIQWLMSSGGEGPSRDLNRRLSENWDPDSRRQIRVTINKCSRLIQRTAATTHPNLISVECLPPDADMSTDASQRAQVAEDAIGAIADASGYLNSRRVANFRRSLAGAWGVGQSIAMGPGGEATDIMGSFDFSPAHLSLDPHVDNMDLAEHFEVLYTDVWTLQKAKAIWPEVFMDVDPDDLPSVGQLAPYHTMLAEASNGRVFSSLEGHSDSKGVLVHQLHCREGSTSRFDGMYVLAEMPTTDRQKRDEFRWLNKDNPESPIGGNGMPLTLLQGHMRGTGQFGVGDMAMLVGDQQRINWIMSVFFRSLRKYSDHKIMVDRRSIPHGKQEDDVRKDFTNEPSGIIFYDSTQHQRPAAAPQYVQTPPPPNFLHDVSRTYEQNMVDQSHRSPGNFGQTKSHVPDASFQRALDEADQVLGIRVENDLSLDKVMMTNMLCTGAAMARSGSAQILSKLKQAGFQPQDYGILATEIDFVMPAVKLRVRESSVRFRSTDARRRDLQEAQSNQTISGLAARFELAKELDLPLFTSDRFFAREAEKSTRLIIEGMDWEPVPLGEHAELFIGEFRKALFDRKAKLDPEARQRLVIAIQSQGQVWVQEQLESDPQTALALQQQEAAAPQQQPTVDSNGGISVDAILSQIEAASGLSPAGAV